MSNNTSDRNSPDGWKDETISSLQKLVQDQEKKIKDLEIEIVMLKKRVIELNLSETSNL